jgi:hypothetical protein
MGAVADGQDASIEDYDALYHQRNCIVWNAAKVGKRQVTLHPDDAQWWWRHVNDKGFAVGNDDVIPCKGTKS